MTSLEVIDDLKKTMAMQQDENVLLYKKNTQLKESLKECKEMLEKINKLI